MQPSQKHKKYDRQLRLWASNGQDRLEGARVCLLGCSTVGTEALKNIILPGIGHVTLIDCKMVEPKHLSSNFFLREADLSLRRCRASMPLLLELNPSVEVEFIEEDPKVVCSSRGVNFWKQYDLIVVGKHDPDVIECLKNTVYPLNIPVAVLDSVGFYGMVEICVKEHTVVESHPNSLVDLRLDCPWKGLSDYAASFDLASMSPEELDHVPYVVLLLIYLENWKTTHNGNMPLNFQERKEFKQLLLNSMQGPDNENYQEAVAAVWRLSQSSSVSEETWCILNDPQADNINPDTSVFWILVNVLKQYVTNDPEKNLPLSGVLPDMKASTKTYVDLQQVYRRKAKHDFEIFKALYLNTVKSLGNVSEDKYLSDEDIETFCKNSRYIRVIKGRLISEVHSENQRVEDSEWAETYSAIVAYRRFEAKNFIVPTIDDIQVLREVALDILRQITGSAEVADDRLDNILQELLRSQGVELVNISSFIGGIAAQEIIKLICHQYIPLDNVVVYNGIESSTGNFKL